MNSRCPRSLALLLILVACDDDAADTFGVELGPPASDAAHDRAVDRDDSGLHRDAGLADAAPPPDGAPASDGAALDLGAPDAAERAPDARTVDAAETSPDADLADADSADALPADADLRAPDARPDPPDEGLPDEGSPDADVADEGVADAAPPDAASPLDVKGFQAIFDAECGDCHVDERQGGLSLDAWLTQTRHVNPVQTRVMPLVWPGDHSESYLFHKLAGTHREVGGRGARMPTGGPFFDEATLAELADLIDDLPFEQPPPEVACGDERDGDFDGLVDCDDPDCAEVPRCAAEPERCEDGVDNDLDTLPDCQDPDCFDHPACPPEPEVCDDGVDNDRDTRFDCCDPACAGVGPCAPLPAEPFTAEEVEAVLGAACRACHIGGPIEGTLSLDPPFQVGTVGVPSHQVPALDRIEPGDRERSYLYLKIAGRHLEAGGEGLPMPTDQRLCAPDIERIGLWIDELPPAD